MTATVEQLRGLTQREIDEIEHDQAAPLAGTYRRFLEMTGGGAGHVLPGSDVFHPLVLGVGGAPRELLEENRVPFATRRRPGRTA